MSRGLLIVAMAFTLLAFAAPAWAHVDAPVVAAAPPVVIDLGPDALSAAEPVTSSLWPLAAGAPWSCSHRCAAVAVPSCWC